MTPTPLTFTPPASGSTRLSPDVWTLICDHAASNGNSSPREALEQLVRQSLGNAHTVGSNCMEPITNSRNEVLPIPSAGAAAALDALLID